MNYWKNYFTKSITAIFIVSITFIIALLLSILPMPSYLKWMMPNWLALVLIYWMVFMPKLIGIAYIFLLTCAIDILLGNFIGTMGLCLLPIAFFADLLCYKFRTFSIGQQFLMISVLVGVGQLIRLWVQLYIHHPPSNIMYWVNVPISTITWPLLCMFLHMFNKVIKFC